MPLTFEVTELFEGRTSGGSRKEHAHVRRFSVRSSEPCASSLAASAPGVPIFGSAYAGPDGFVNLALYAKRISVRALSQGRNYYEVDVEYSNVLDTAPGGLDGTGDPLAEAASPLDAPWLIRFGTATVTENILEDTAGDAILNAAGAPFESGLAVERGHLTMTVTRNEAASAYDDLAGMSGLNDLVWHVNDATWNGQAAKTVLITDISTGDRQLDRGVYYYPVTYSFKFARAGLTWARRVLNAGHYYLKAAGSTVKVRFMDESMGQPLAGAGLLAADGTKLNYPTNPPVFIEFDVYPEGDFTLLAM